MLFAQRAVADMTPATSKRRVALVVDDDEGNRLLLHRILKAEGYEVVQAATGASAMAAIKSHSPDVILLDAHLPGGMDGFEVCRRVRRDPGTRSTPVIMVTGLQEAERRVAGKAVGIDAFVTKPFKVDQLRASIAAVCEGRAKEGGS